MVRGRVRLTSICNRYAQLLVQERQLTHLVNNLLAYSRVTEVAEVYSFEPSSRTRSFPKRRRDSAGS